MDKPMSSKHLVNVFGEYQNIFMHLHHVHAPLHLTTYSNKTISNKPHILNNVNILLNNTYASTLMKKVTH